MANNGATPPIIFDNIIIVGGINPNADDGRREDIRGFDAATGRQLWRFNTIPREGEVGYETWPAGAIDREVNSNVSMWGFPSVDAQRGIVYIPLDSPQWERWGGDRVGDNLYGNAIVALDARTGRRLWHFQTVHHDLWDLDMAGAATLFDVNTDGRTVPALGVIGKNGLLFILDRTTGEPVFGVEERPVPQSMMEGERSSPTQPFPIRPEALGRQSIAEGEIARITPEHTAACEALIAEANPIYGGPYNPPSRDRPAVNFPGARGSGNFGGMTFNPDLRLLFVNVQNLGQLTQVGPRGEPMRQNGTTGVRAPNIPGQPFDMVGFNGRFAIVEPELLPCQPPPWGELAAVNVDTGDVVWRSTLGVTDSMPEGLQLTGRPNIGGPVATASGLVFIGATDDSRFRAFDARTGRSLWETRLGSQADATPITYEAGGRQYVAMTAGTTLHVFALP